MTTPEPAPRILFPHIAKTGGTSVLYHFRNHFGPEGMFVYGPHNRCKRFFGGLAQLEELSPEERASARVIQGHGVSQEVIGLMNDPAIRLMIVLREPVSLTRSRYNQRVNAAERKDLDISSEKFMRKLARSEMTRKILDEFPDFADPDAPTPGQKAISVLRKFDYVVTTTEMATQLQPMFARYGLPQDMERRRVAEKKAVLEATDEEIRAVNADDIALHDAFNRTVESDGTSHNAAGFDAEGKAQVVQSLIDRLAGDTETLREHCYKALAYALCVELRAEAALALMDEAPEAVPVADLASFRPILEADWARKRDGLSEAGAKRADEIRKRTLMKHRRSA